MPLQPLFLFTALIRGTNGRALPNDKRLFGVANLRTVRAMACQYGVGPNMPTRRPINVSSMPRTAPQGDQLQQASGNRCHCAGIEP
jgi:hypothetical protein